MQSLFLLFEFAHKIFLSFDIFFLSSFPVIKFHSTNKIWYPFLWLSSQYLNCSHVSILSHQKLLKRIDSWRQKYDLWLPTPNSIKEVFSTHAWMNFLWECGKILMKILKYEIHRFFTALSQSQYISIQFFYVMLYKFHSTIYGSLNLAQCKNKKKNSSSLDYCPIY